MVRAGTVLVVLAVAMMAAACGGGNERATTLSPATVTVSSASASPSSATTGATAIATAQASPQLEKALLTLDDMPTGWTVDTSSSESTNAASMCGKDPMPEKPAGKASRDFKKSAFIQATSTVQQWDRGKAKQSMQTAREVFESCREWTDTDKDGKPETYHLAALSFPKLGDETLAVRITLDASIAALDADVVYVRRGDYITIVGNFAAGFGVAQVDSALTEDLARKADAKLQALTAR